MIVVGTTLTTFAMLDPERSFLWDAWLRNAEAIKASHPDGVVYFAAIQVDDRGIEPFEPLLDRLREVGGSWWTYSLHDGRSRVTQSNRLRHITTGQNLISTFATDYNASHLLHMAADTEPPPDVLPKLLEARNGVAAASCSTYCFDYDPLPEYADFPVAGPPMTAVCVLLEREVFKRLRWRADPDLGMTDDPSLTHDAKTLLGVETLTRIDCEAIHHPQTISRIEDRFPGLDMSVQHRA